MRGEGAHLDELGLARKASAVRWREAGEKQLNTTDSLLANDADQRDMFINNKRK